MPDTIVKPIVKPAPTIRIVPSSAKQANRPVQRKIVEPPNPPRITRILPARPLLPAKQNIETELAKIRRAFGAYQQINRRDAVYIYLSKVFQVVTRWQRLGCALKNARAALRLRAEAPQMKLEPFAIVIFCTSDPETVDAKTRSKWSRVLRYAARAKPAGQRLTDFIKSKGLNECARRFARNKDIGL